jgi:hypothetical protein
MRAISESFSRKKRGVHHVATPLQAQCNLTNSDPNMCLVLTSFNHFSVDPPPLLGTSGTPHQLLPFLSSVFILYAPVTSVPHTQLYYPYRHLPLLVTPPILFAQALYYYYPPSPIKEMMCSSCSARGTASGMTTYFWKVVDRTKVTWISNDSD